MSVDDRLPSDVLEDLGADRAHYLREAERVTALLKEAMRDAADAGVPETDIAAFAGVTRMTVRSWLGK